jgi:hypothetical protein
LTSELSPSQEFSCYLKKMTEKENPPMLFDHSELKL